MAKQLTIASTYAHLLTSIDPADGIRRLRASPAPTDAG